MKILIVVPTMRVIEAVIERWAALDLRGHDCRWAFLTDGDDPGLHRFQNITNKMGRAREMFLAGGYDSMLIFDDDQLLPADTIPRLIALEADIAYGLTVWRHWPHYWSVATALSENAITTADKAGRAAQYWGQAVDCVGVGGFCTLIRRPVLEALEFQRRGPHCFDWYLALDCQAQGFSQRADCGLIVGHVGEKETYWPAPWGYTVTGVKNGN